MKNPLTLSYNFAINKQGARYAGLRFPFKVFHIQLLTGKSVDIRIDTGLCAMYNGYIKR